MDLISRQAAIDALERVKTATSENGERWIAKINAQMELEQLPSAQLATDNNVGTKLGTNLAEVGTDCISRQQAIETFKDCAVNGVGIDGIVDALEQLPPAEPDIIRCRECKFASGDSRICMKFGHSPIGELDFCSFAERREVNNESN